MFTQPYFPGRAFAQRYFPHGGLTILVVLGVPGVHTDYVTRQSTSDAVEREAASDGVSAMGAMEDVEVSASAAGGARLGGIG